MLVWPREAWVHILAPLCTSCVTGQVTTWLSLVFLICKRGKYSRTNLVRLPGGLNVAADEKELARCWVHVLAPTSGSVALCPQLALGSPSTKSSRVTEAL